MQWACTSILNHSRVRRRGGQRTLSNMDVSDGRLHSCTRLSELTGSLSHRNEEQDAERSLDPRAASKKHQYKLNTSVSSWGTVHLWIKIDGSACITQVNDLHLNMLGGTLLMIWINTMTQRMDSKRKEAVDGFLVHTCMTSWSKVTTYSYVVRPALRVSLRATFNNIR